MLVATLSWQLELKYRNRKEVLVGREREKVQVIVWGRRAVLILPSLYRRNCFPDIQAPRAERNVSFPGKRLAWKKGECGPVRPSDNWATMDAY